MKKTFLIALSGILLLSSSNPGRKKDAESRRILKNQDTAYIYNFSVDGLNYINDFTENVTYDDNSKGVIAYMAYEFQKTYLADHNNAAPYRGDFVTYQSALYSVENYSHMHGQCLKITADTTATSQKFTVGFKYCTGYEIRSASQSRTISIVL